MNAVARPFWKPPEPRPRDLRQFGLLLAALSAALSAWLAWRQGWYEAVGPALASVAVLALSFAAPRLLTPAWWPWMVLVNVLGFVNSHLLLALVLYLLFTPIGLLLRLFGHDPLDLDFRRARRALRADGTTTFWHRRGEPQLPEHHYERQF